MRSCRVAAARVMLPRCSQGEVRLGGFQDLAVTGSGRRPQAPPFPVPGCGRDPRWALPRPGAVSGSAWQLFFGGPGRAPLGDYELSRGKIVDVLSDDYRLFFDRPPDFEIYDDNVVLEVGSSLVRLPVVRGRTGYRRLLALVQGACWYGVKNGTMSCKVTDGEPYGHAIRIFWTMRGQSRRGKPLLISGYSLYSLGRQAASASGTSLLTHRINRHVIEFTEVRPHVLKPQVANAAMMGMMWPQWGQPEMALATGAPRDDEGLGEEWAALVAGLGA